LTPGDKQPYARRAKADEPSGSPALAFFVAPCSILGVIAPGGGYWGKSNPVEVDQMGFLDRLLGRNKKAAGDTMGDSSMRREGAAQEREPAMQDQPEQHDQMGQQPDQAADSHSERENM
jgi:uncharacterized protein YjbJ (UPF0337 family)